MWIKVPRGSRKLARFVLFSLVLTVVTTVPSLPVLAAPANDEFESATPVTALPFEDETNTRDATTAVDDPPPPCGSGNPARSVWYAFTATEDARIQADTRGSNYDTILSVWTGARGSLQNEACNDDAIGVTSAAFFDVSAGQTYYLMVSSYSGPGGSLRLAVGPAPEDLALQASVEDKAWVNAISGQATVTGEVTCTEPADVVVQLVLTQRRDEGVRRGFGSTQLHCEGTERWLLQVGGSFRKGDAGVDALAYWNLDPNVRASSSLIVALRSCTIIGSLGDDIINGSNRNDKICSLAGNDILRGRDGDDQLRGHDGDDVIMGGSGNDLLTGGFGNDVLEGASGRDTLYGDAGNDRLVGGRGKDRCTGGSGRDSVRSCERRI
jgi:hypothetical protein